VIVRRATVAAFAIPLRHPVVTARGAIRERRGLVLRVEDERGVVGIGEAAPHPLAAETGDAATARACAERAAARLVGADLEQIDQVIADARHASAWIASGVDLALHDLVARGSLRSVVELLGGARRRHIIASALIEAEEPGECRERVASAACAGYGTVKLKLPRDPAAAVERLRAARAAAPALALRGDANGAWEERAARRACVALSSLGLEWLEQPLPAADLEGLARLRRASTVAIAADEPVSGADAVERLVEHGAADAVVLKLTQTGGMRGALEAARAAAAAGLALAVTTTFDTSIATAAVLQLAAALPGDLRASGVATTGLLAGDLVRSPIRDAPSMPLPAGPGLGVELDPVALARWRIA